MRRVSISRPLCGTALAVFLVSWAGMAMAQDATPAKSSTSDVQDVSSRDGDASSATAPSTDILVTGTLIKGLQTSLPVPMTVITEKDMVARGYTSVADALQRSSVATGVVSGSDSGYTQGARTISMFGFAPGFTKFLVEGRPTGNYPALYNNQTTFVDIGAIPSTLIERIEILPGGQSSLYGSDAIAGVVNIQLKRKLDGPVAEARLGLYEHGGGRSLRVALADGVETGNLSLIGGIQYDDIHPIWAFQRALTRTSTRNGSTPYEPSAVFALKRPDFTNITPPSGACSAVANQFNNSVSLYDLPGSGSYCANTNYEVQTLTNEEKRLQGYGHAVYGLGGDNELYGDVLFNRSTAKFTGATSSVFFLSNPYYSANLGETYQFLRVFSPEEFGGLDNRLSSDRLTSITAAVGVRGTLGGPWSYDASVQHVRQDFDRSIVALVSAPLSQYIESLLGPRTGTEDDPDYGPIPIREPNLAAFFKPISNFGSFYDQYRAKADTRTTWGRLLVSNKGIVGLPGGDAAIAFAVEGATESWNYTPASRIGTGYFRNLLADVRGDGTRRWLAGVTELQAPVLQFLTLSGSLRYDRYFTSGVETGKASWNVAGELRPFGDVARLRARYGTAFKAPTLSDAFQGASSQIGFSTDYVRCAKLGFTPANIGSCPSRGVIFQSTTSGNPALNPLTADVFDAGVTLSPKRGIAIALDYLRWRVKGIVRRTPADEVLLQEYRCTLPGADAVLCAADDSLVKRDAASGRLISVFTAQRNQALLNVDAITADATARQEIGRFGALNLNVNYSLLLKRESQNIEGAAIIDELSTPGYYAGARSKLTAYLGWSRGILDATLGFDRTGRTPDNLSSFGDPGNKLSPWTIWSLSAGVQATSKIRFTAIANNLFDTDPPNDPSTPGYSKRPFASIANPYGRQILLQANVSF